MIMRNLAVYLVTLAGLAFSLAQPASAEYIAIDLTPTEPFRDAIGYGISGGQQVGSGFLPTRVFHALLWSVVSSVSHPVSHR